MVFVVLYCAKSSLKCQKSQKETLSFQSKAGRPFSMMKNHPWHSFQAQTRRERCCCSLQSSPCCHPKQKADTATNTHTNIQNKERPTHSKFKIQIQIARKNAHEVVSGATYRDYLCHLGTYNIWRSKVGDICWWCNGMAHEKPPSNESNGRVVRPWPRTSSKWHFTPHP